MTDLPHDPTTWTPENVASWCVTLNKTFTPEANALFEASVNGEDLVEITDAQLKMLGIKSTLRRMKIMKNVNKLREDLGLSSEPTTPLLAEEVQKVRRDPLPQKPPKIKTSATPPPRTMKSKAKTKSPTPRTSTPRASRSSKSSRASSPAPSDPSKRKITEEDLKAFLKFCGCKIGDRESKKFFKDLDSKREGSIMLRELKRGLLRTKIAKLKKCLNRDNVEKMYAKFCGDDVEEPAKVEEYLEEAGAVKVSDPVVREPPLREMRQAPKQKRAPEPRPKTKTRTPDPAPPTRRKSERLPRAAPKMEKLRSLEIVDQIARASSPEVQEVLVMDRLECDIVNKDSVITQQKMRIQELEMMVERSRGDLLQKELDLQLSMKAVADSMDLSESTTDKCDKLQALCEELHLKCEKQQTKYENLENQIADKEMDYQARIEELERQMTHRTSHVESKHAELLNMSGALMDQLETSAMELEGVKSKLEQAEVELDQYRSHHEEKTKDEEAQRLAAERQANQMQELRSKLEDANMEIEILKTSSQVSDKLRESLESAQAEIAELQKQQIENLEANVKHVEDKTKVELEEARIQIQKLNQQLQESQSSPPAETSSNEDLDAARKENELLKQQLQELKESTAQGQDCIPRLVSRKLQMFDLQEASVSSESILELEVSRKEIEKLKHQLIELQKGPEITDQTLELEEARMEIDELLEKLEAQRLQEAQTSPQKDSTSLELEEARQQIHELSEQLEGFKKDPTQSPPMHSADEFENLRKKLEEAEMEIEICQTAEEVSDLLRKELKQKEHELNSVRCEISSRSNEEELSAAKQDIRELMKQLQEAQHFPQNDNTSLELEEAKQQINELSKKLEDSQKSLADLDEARKEIDSLKKQIEKSQASPDFANVKLEEAKQKISELSKRLQEAQNSPQENKTSLELEEAKQQIHELSMKLEEAHNSPQKDNASLELEEAKVQILELSKRLESFKKDPTQDSSPVNSPDELEILRKKLKEAEREIQRQQLINTAEDVSDLLRKELSQKELELQEKDLQLHSIRSEMSSKNNEEELSAAKQEIRELMKQLQISKTIEDANDCLRIEIQQKEQNIQQREEEMKQKEGELQLRRGVFVKEKLKLESQFEEEIFDYQRELEEVKTELFLTRQVVQDKDVEVEILRDQVVEMRDTLESKDPVHADFAQKESI